MKLTPRLLKVSEFVKNGEMVADVGTDHAYIAVYLVENEISKKVIATDVNEGPLNSANKNIKLYGFENNIETRLGNGLEKIKPNEVDTVIIAGMGGLLIRDILLGYPNVTKSIDKFVLQPMVAQDELREWLVNNGFCIVDEALVREEHRIYEIMVVKKGKQEVNDNIYFEIGQKLIENKDPLLEEYIQMKINKYQKIMDNLLNQTTENAKRKLEECKEHIKKLEEVKKCLKY
ncbi:SAM-dependent methyltransferase [Lutibacter sp. B2]|nr:SAM-dependent methyltransferase [Lutibacter sp. B2]